LRKLKPDGPDETTGEEKLPRITSKVFTSCDKKKIEKLDKKNILGKWKYNFLLNFLPGSKESIRIPVVLPHRVENRRLSLSIPFNDLFNSLD
jgi:hypothetical protein